MFNSTARQCVWLLCTFAAIVAMWLVHPVQLDVALHAFDEGRDVFRLRNLSSVISCLPMTLVGVWGIYSVLRARAGRSTQGLPSNYLVFFAGMALTGLVGAYYHWQPNEAGWGEQRLPMTIAFMAFFSLLLGELVHMAIARRSAWPLTLCGIVSILAWAGAEAVELAYSLGGDGLLHLVAACVPAALLFTARSRQRRWRAAKRLVVDDALRRGASGLRRGDEPSWAAVPVRAEVPRRYASRRAVGR